MEESRCKKLHAKKSTNQQLQLALYTKTIQEVEATGLPFFIIDKSKQLGKSFGEKLANAFELVFQKNFHSVIAIGNDCPQLSVEILLEAASKINRQQMILGPDRKGGVYLLGITSECFKAKAIRAIPWQTKKVFPSLLEYQKGLAIDSGILPRLSDFNRLSNYFFLKTKFHSLHSFIKLITIIISGENVHRFVTLCSMLPHRFCSIRQLRAPPYYC